MKMNELLETIKIQASQVIFERYMPNLELVINSNSFIDVLSHSEDVTIETVESRTKNLKNDLRIASMCHGYKYTLGSDDISNYNFIVDCGISSGVIINIKIINDIETKIGIKHLVQEVL